MMKKQKTTYDAIKSVIFDFGNVLFHWNPKETFSHLQKNFPTLRGSFCSFVSTRAWKLFDEGCIDEEALVNLLALEFEPKAVSQFVEIAKTIFVPMPQSQHWIGFFKKLGCKLYYLSNLSKTFFQKIKNYPLLKQFDGGVASYEVGVSKPDCMIYKKLLERYPGIKPQEALFIDDRPENVSAAKLLGLNALCLSGEENLFKALRKENFCIGINCQSLSGKRGI